MSADKFVSHARSLIGVKWRHRGRKPWGIDCVGLVSLSAHAAGHPASDVVRYGREPWDGRLRKELVERFGQPVDVWRPGDVALIRWRADEPSHVGIIGDHPGGGLSLIHVHNLHGVVEHAVSGHFLACIVEVFRPWPN